MNADYAWQTEQWLKDLLSKEMSSRGLEWIPQMHQFRHSFPGGFFCVILSVSGYTDCAVAEVHIGIRIDAVEDLAFPHTNNLAAFQPNSMTLVTSMARLLGERIIRYEIITEEDASAAIWQISPQLLQDGLPFLARYQDIKCLERLYNEQPHFPVPYLHNAIHRCFRGIALAKIVGHPNFSPLCDTYLEVLKNRYAPDQTIQKYNRLVSFLKNYSHN